MSAYGLSGPLELPRPPRTIPIHRALPRFPIPPQRPPRPMPIQRPLLRSGLVPKATPAYPNSSATSQAHNTLLTPRPEPSCEPFEPHRDQVRRDGITRSHHIPRGVNEPPCPAITSARPLLAQCTPSPPRQRHPYQTLRRRRHSAQLNTRLHATTGRSTSPSHPSDPYSNGRSTQEPGQSAPGSMGNRAPKSEGDDDHHTTLSSKHSPPPARRGDRVSPKPRGRTNEHESLE